MFNWRDCTLNECAWHIARTSAQRTSAMLKYYESRENLEVVEKILKARTLAKKYRALIRAELITEELVKDGTQIADYFEFKSKDMDQ